MSYNVVVKDEQLKKDLGHTLTESASPQNITALKEKAKELGAHVSVNEDTQTVQVRRILKD